MHILSIFFEYMNIISIVPFVNTLLWRTLLYFRLLLGCSVLRSYFYMKMNHLHSLVASFFMLSSVLSLPANADCYDCNTLRLEHPRIAFKADPIDYLAGSFNAELEIWTSHPNISFVLPVFFANHDAAVIKNGLLWNSSLGVNLGVKFKEAGHGFYGALEGGVFVIYPFERGTRHIFGGPCPSGTSVYSEVQKSPAALPVVVARAGYDYVFDNGFMIDGSAGISMYGQFPWPMARVQVGWAF